MVAKIKFSQLSHYSIYTTATPQESQGGCAIFWGEFLFPEIALFDGSLAFCGVVFQEVAVGDRLQFLQLIIFCFGNFCIGRKQDNLVTG